MRPVEIDFAGLSAAYAVECEATSQCRPGWVPLGESARLAAWLADDGWSRRFVGAFDGGGLVGFASASTADDTPDTTWVAVAVRPGHQRRGIGTLLVRSVEESSPPGVERFVANAYRPTAEEIDGLVKRFARPLGYAAASSETVVELDLRAADLPELSAPSGYSVSTYLGGVPPETRAEVGVLKGLVDAEAPHGDLGWQPTPVSVQEYEDEIALFHEQGRTVVESIAMSGDRVVAWTCLVVAADPRRPAQVEGTFVRPEHRGNGLGRQVKLASMLAARDRTDAVRVRTSSDDENVWMRAVNVDLGFVPVECEVIVQKRRVGG